MIGTLAALYVLKIRTWSFGAAVVVVVVVVVVVIVVVVDVVGDITVRVVSVGQSYSGQGQPLGHPD